LAIASSFYFLLTFFAFYVALFAATIAIAIAIISANSEADRRPKTKAKLTHFHAEKGRGERWSGRVW